jgi:hypothetical protein
VRSVDRQAGEVDRRLDVADDGKPVGVVDVLGGFWPLIGRGVPSGYGPGLRRMIGYGPASVRDQLVMDQETEILQTRGSALCYVNPAWSWYDRIWAYEHRRLIT